MIGQYICQHSANIYVNTAKFKQKIPRKALCVFEGLGLKVSRFVFRISKVSLFQSEAGFKHEQLVDLNWSGVVGWT